MFMANSSAYLLGYDVGSSSIKASLMEAETGKLLGSATSPKAEMAMQAPHEGWAEQDPEAWWQHIVNATSELKQNYPEAMNQVAAIGISYQMHGLVVVDAQQRVLRPSIIWCDSRAVATGQMAFEALGEETCLQHCLNSPGNFTASKLRWVKENEPEVYKKIHKAMLPGDFVAMKMTGDINTTISGLSEGIFWDFKEQSISYKLLDHYGIDASLLPDITPTFAVQGELNREAARELGLPVGIKVAYRAGDQPNNALSLNVLRPGEVATTAGTSGVIYGVSDQLEYDLQSRVNTFAHVNYSPTAPKYGILACINGTGILNSWLKNNLLHGKSYDEMNNMAAGVSVGADGVVVLPFGNGAERTLNNRDLFAHFHGLRFNTHQAAHLLRAAQEGIVFALKYSFDIMQNMGLVINTVRAGKANMFLSPVFQEAFANTTGATVELYNTDGSQGAARGAGVGAGIYQDFAAAFSGLQKLQTVEPQKELQTAYTEAYGQWLKMLEKQLE